MSQNTELKAQTKKPGLNKKGIAAWINNYSFILIALAIFIAYLFINHGATTWSGVMNILRHSAVVGIMAFGMGRVIITGGIDLSVGSMLALVGSFSVVVFNATDSVFLTLLFALVAGGLCGLFNGVLIGLVKMPAFIVTLATMLIFRSVAQYYLRTTGSSIFNMTGTLDHYASFYGFGQLKIATVPVVGIVLLVVTVIMVFISTCTKFGKTVYALGSNERAAALAGINVNRTRGISMSGGKGKLLGVLFGAMSYTIIDKIIASLQVDALINDTIKGSILLVAVIIQLVVPMIRSRVKTKHTSEV